MKKNTLTTIADLSIDDVFSRPGYAQQWRIISTQTHYKGEDKKAWHIMAVLTNAETLQPKSFRKNEQVVYLKTAVCV